MPGIAAVLKDEISRLARKEIRSETEALKKASSQYRSQIAALRNRIEGLERQLKRTAKGVAKSVPTKTSEDDQGDARLKLRAQGFAQHRKRLGLSAREMGLLLDASALSVYKWESGQAKPRAKHLAAIAAVRKMGMREATKRLDEVAADA